MLTKKRFKVLSLHPRKQHNFEQAAALAEIFQDDFRHVTSIYLDPGFVAKMRKWLPSLSNQLAKRSYYKLPKKYVLSLPAAELKKAWREKINKGIHLDDYLNLNEFWQKTVLRRFRAPEICISYDSISNLVFKSWKKKTKLILDLAIGLPQYRQKIKFGDQFKMTHLDEADDQQKYLYKRYQTEIELADLILCGSEFVKETVVYFFPQFEEKCKVLPYGVDLEKFDFPERSFSDKQDLKYVFVGRLSWRKGADTMVEAWRQFVKDHPLCELHFFGVKDAEISLDDLPSNTFMHGWVSRPELINRLKEMDVFVFPTTFEGSSTAVFQAMALKLPVITTRNSGTILKHGESCEIVETGNLSGLIQSMDKVFRNREYREKIANCAYELSKGYSWDDYRQRLTQILQEAGLLEERETKAKPETAISNIK